MTTEQTTPTLASTTCCLLIHFQRPGVSRKLREDQYEVAAERELVRASKTILDSPEYAHVGAQEASIKHYLKGVALPSRLYRDATYLVPIALVSKVDAYLVAAREQWQERVDAFISTYPARRAETMARLAGVASEDDYLSTSQMRAAFGFEHEWVTLSTPSTLKQVSAEMFQREEERLKARLSAAEDEIKAAFRQQFTELVEMMKEMLDGGTTETGRSKQFRADRVAKFSGFIEQFRASGNVCGDEALDALAKEAGLLLEGVDVKQLKRDEVWRANLSMSFKDLGTKLDTLTKARGRRAFDEEA